jgi:uncharacterized membrane protein (DUF485 family)
MIKYARIGRKRRYSPQFMLKSRFQVVCWQRVFVFMLSYPLLTVFFKILKAAPSGEFM